MSPVMRAQGWALSTACAGGRAPAQRRVGLAPRVLLLGAGGGALMLTAPLVSLPRKPQPEPKREKEAKKPTIKKPLNAFMLYMKEMRAKVIAECTLKESAAINQILGRRVRVGQAQRCAPVARAGVPWGGPGEQSSTVGLSRAVMGLVPWWGACGHPQKQGQGSGGAEEVLPSL